MGKLLTSTQVEQYQRDGILFPVPVLSAVETARFRAAFEEVAGHLGGRPVAQALGHTQTYFRWAYDLATHPVILDAVEDLLGPDILVWTVSIFPRSRDPGLHLVAPGRHVLGPGLDPGHDRMGGADGQHRGDRLHASGAGLSPAANPAAPGHVRPGQPPEPRPGDRGGGRREGRRRRGPAGRRDVAPPRQHHPRLEPEPLGPLADRLRSPLHDASDPGDRRRAPDRRAGAGTRRLPALPAPFRTAVPRIRGGRCRPAGGGRPVPQGDPEHAGDTTPRGARQPRCRAGDLGPPSGGTTGRWPDRRVASLGRTDMDAAPGSR